MENDRLNKELDGFQKTDELKQSLALVDILRDLLDTTKRQLNKIYILLLVSILSNLIIVGAFLWYESHMTTTVETTTETVTTQTVDGDDAEINNVEGNQYNDNAVHNQN